ncbi:hypothetical protein BC834DRAFT_886610 [Gloeopeniophorella convolvens]|nr:hypothetical protein BC834DRAFT_886610 [Gloeopeniophorella convolvens]
MYPRREAQRTGTTASGSAHGTPTPRTRTRTRTSRGHRTSRAHRAGSRIPARPSCSRPPAGAATRRQQGASRQRLTPREQVAPLPSPAVFVRADLAHLLRVRLGVVVSPVVRLAAPDAPARARPTFDCRAVARGWRTRKRRPERPAAPARVVLAAGLPHGRAPPVFLAPGARRPCVPYMPVFQGVDLRVVRPLSTRASRCGTRSAYL